MQGVYIPKFSNIFRFGVPIFRSLHQSG